MKLRGFIIIGAILSIVVGFFLGRAVIADSPVPGSGDDPVVTKSYADKAIQERVTELEKSVAELSVQAKALQSTINELQDKVNRTPSTTSPKPVTPPVGNKDDKPDKPITETKPPEKIDSDVVGKTGYISTQNYANLRSAPTLEASVLKKVTKDEGMLVQKTENGWYNVKLDDGTVGWISSTVVQIKN
ncbi:MAG: SH3 domain-containing protein [Clostridia bacterium]|jgi:uncharacterized protein YgiM (DUF1202 family)|nr:SH3 domain-containing protein [Clostridia bacterium]MDD4146782.1 SH3 domain-containing protein [Clostridia bacterium]MDD4665516.1 SH3 domain-containing protein [Clostridia bacterium]